MLAKRAFLSGLNLGKCLLVGTRHASGFKFVPETAPAELGETTKMNLCQAVTNALDITLSSDKSAGMIAMCVLFAGNENVRKILFFFLLLLLLKSCFRRGCRFRRRLSLYGRPQGQVRQRSSVQYASSRTRHCCVRYWPCRSRCHCYCRDSVRRLYFSCL